LEVNKKAGHMATRVVCSPLSAEFPSSAFAQLTKSNERPVVAFDAATDENVYWSGIAPQGLAGAVTVVVTYAMASATTGAVRFQAALEAITDGDAVDTDATSSFDTDNSAGASVPGTAGYIDQLSISMTNADSIAAGDYFRLRLRRDADGTSGTDDASGDCLVLAVELRDAA
jgi:hypothetical protein